MKHLFYILAILTIVLAPTANAAPVQWTTTAGGNGHWYEVVTIPNKINWDAASNAAAAKNGYLATITSSQENDFIFNLANQAGGAWFSYANWQIGPWLGGYQPAGSAEPDGGWTWVSGESWGYTNWSPAAFTDTASVENALHYAGWNDTKAATWNDNWEHSQTNGYIMEWNSNPVPEPSAILGLLCGLSGIAWWRRNK